MQSVPRVELFRPTSTSIAIVLHLRVRSGEPSFSHPRPDKFNVPQRLWHHEEPRSLPWYIQLALGVALRCRHHGDPCKPVVRSAHCLSTAGSCFHRCLRRREGHSRSQHLDTAVYRSRVPWRRAAKPSSSSPSSAPHQKRWRRRLSRLTSSAISVVSRSKSGNIMVSTKTTSSSSSPR